MESYSEEFNICPLCGFQEGAKATEVLHMEPGNILQGRYIVGKVLGFGGFGVTYIGWDALLEQKVAIKEYLPSEFSTRIPGQTQVTVFNGDKAEQYVEGLRKFVDEAQRLAKFHSLDGIVRIFDSFADNNTAYIVMECLEGETLAECLKRRGTIPPAEAIELLMPVVKSLRAVHELGIIHRDIAPDNIFLTSDGQAKLIDFGAARFATTSLSRSLTVIIKPGYSPEEQYRSKGDQGPYTDVYAVGATLYRMITGAVPPDALERRAYFESKRKDVLRPLSAYYKDITDDQETAILNALNVRIEDRTPDMASLEIELSGEGDIARRQGRIGKIDVLKWPIWAKIATMTAMLAVVVIGALFAAGVIKFEPALPAMAQIPEDMSLVPSIINNEIDEAEQRLSEVLLWQSIVGKEYSSDIPVNRVLTQAISAGSVVYKNTTIDIVVSGGAETRTVPNVEGWDINDARQILEDLGFDVQIDYVESQFIAKDSVVSQSVAGNEEYELGASITLMVSLGADIEQVMSTVPKLVGLSYEDAMQAARNAGFVVRISSSEYSGIYDENIVMEQSVAAGTSMMSGETIELTVSLGIQQIRVPDVVYMTETNASIKLASMGLKVEVEEYQGDTTVASGVVAEQDPLKDTMVGPGDTVTLYVSGGSEKFQMPPVIGMSEADARNALQNLGLVVASSRAESTTVAEGMVISQSIAANTEVSRGTEVGIVVSSGSGNSQNTAVVPNVRGQSETDARNTLADREFKVNVNRTYNDNVAKDYVISQNPAANTTQAKGSTVVINVSDGPAPISVPNVVNRTRSSAESTIRNAGLNVSVSNTEVFSDSVPAGSVVTQSPAAGASAKKGDTVTLTISKGKETVTIPDVRNQSRTSATNTLRNLGLNVDYREDNDDNVAADNVISQSPTAGSAVAKGDRVVLTISLGKRDTGPKLPTDITLSPSYMTLSEGGSQQINATVLPQDATDKTIRWESSDPSVASVNANGLVTANSPGSASITATAVAGNVSRSCNVTVEKKAIRRLEVSSMPSKREYTAGETLSISGLSLKVTYADNSTEVVSSDITTNPANGAALVNNGSSAIQVYIDVTYGGYSQRQLFTVTVYPLAITGVTVSPYTITLNVNETETITATVLPTDAKDTSVMWSSSNTSVATVSSDGVVTAKSPGQTIITAAANADKTKVGICTVTVNTSSITGVAVTPANLLLKINETGQLTATVSPTNASDKTVTWTSSNTSIATVSSGGLVTARAAGTVMITAVSNVDSTKVGICNVTVAQNVTLTGLSVGTTKTTYNQGEAFNQGTVLINATYSDGSTKSIPPSSCSFSGFNSSTPGTKTITVSYAEGGVTRTATFNVEVLAEVIIDPVYPPPDPEEP